MRCGLMIDETIPQMTPVRNVYLPPILVHFVVGDGKMMPSNRQAILNALPACSVTVRPGITKLIFGGPRGARRISL